MVLFLFFIVLLFLFKTNFLGVFDKCSSEKENIKEGDEESGEEIGGLFKKVSKEQERVKIDKDNMNLLDSSLNLPWSNPVENWLEPQVKIIHC